MESFIDAFSDISYCIREQKWKEAVSPPPRPQLTSNQSRTMAAWPVRLFVCHAETLILHFLVAHDGQDRQDGCTGGGDRGGAAAVLRRRHRGHPIMIPPRITPQSNAAKTCIILQIGQSFHS